MGEVRYCQTCQETTPHDSFKDGIAMGEKAPTAERVFFGIVTLGMSEVFTDHWWRCQKCGRKTKQ